MKNKGSILLILIFLVFSAAAIVLLLNHSFLNVDDLQTLKSSIPFIKEQSAPLAIYSSWKTINYKNVGLSLKYPPEWNISDSGILSEYSLPVDVTQVDVGRVYNFITATTHTGVLYAGVYDVDLFNSLYGIEKGKVYNPNFLQENGVKFTKLDSGKIASGQKYVIFQPDNTKSIGGNEIRIIQAYILNSNSLIILTLNNYDQTGLDIFKQILPTASIPLQ